MPLVPFAKDIPQDAFPDGPERTICWGPGFVPRTVAHPRLDPGIWYDDTRFRWSAFRRNWQVLMLSGDAVVIPFEDAHARLTEVPVFLRPDGDTKSFDGGLYMRDRPPTLGTTFEGADVVMAKAQPVEDEWRFFIVDRTIVGSTSYRIMGRANIDGQVPEEAKALAARAAQRWGPANVYCLDVGRSGGRLGLIEANCFNASRFYGARMEPVVRAVTQWTRMQEL